MRFFMACACTLYLGAHSENSADQKAQEPQELWHA